MSELRVRILNTKGQLPKRASIGDAAFDLYTPDYALINPGEIVVVPLGIAFVPPAGHFVRVVSRSGLAIQGVHVVGGIIDWGYRGEVKVILVNSGTHQISLAPGNRVAQALVEKIWDGRCVEITHEEFINHQDTARGASGFGSTGK